MLQNCLTILLTNLLSYNHFNFLQRITKILRIKPFEGTNLNTYALHPWVFIDRSSGQLLHCRNKPVLYGKPIATAREKVFIHLPMKSLQDITLLCLLNHLKDVKVVDKLEIPQILKQDLRKMFLIYEEHKRRLQIWPLMYAQ